MFVPPHGILKLVTKCLRISDSCNSLPYEWNNKEGKFVLKIGKKLKFLNIKRAFVLIFAVFLLLQSILIRNNLTLPQTLQICFYNVYCTFTTYTLFSQKKYAPELVSLLNRMINFEKHPKVHKFFQEFAANGYHQNDGNIGIKLSKHSIVFYTFTSTFLTFLSTLSFLKKPCVPIQPGFFLVKKCNTLDSPMISEGSFIQYLVIPLPSILTTLFLAITTFTLRICMVTATKTHMCMFAPIKAYCFRSYLVYIKLIIQKSTDKSEKLVPTLLREIQLLIQSYNFVYKGSIVWTLVFAISGETLCLYAFINVGHLMTP
ncbi:unnamed protein product [Orchesella dallaii]|uniref:Uncharacterized protein n=1 Tax=Orchesella dallaii TaxID=48710 RepID=A0ABP1RS33_9HEXA